MPLETISLDVKALYPSITAERAAAVVVEQTEKTKVQFDNINYRFAKYLNQNLISWGSDYGFEFAWIYKEDENPSENITNTN